MREEDYARLLRKPEGAAGIEVALNMNRLNSLMYRHCFHLLPPGPISVLEIGPGNAAEAAALLQTRTDIHYTGIDNTQDMVEEGTKRLSAFAGRAVYLLGDAAALPFPTEQFDVLLSINTLYFLDNPEIILQAWLKMLKPGGLMLIGLRSRESMEQRSMQRYGFRLFDAPELLQLMQNAGLNDCNALPIEEAPLSTEQQLTPMHSFVCRGMK
ncbi:MAG: methyltransferase domain-containing protein [Bacteroidetes bacterium]|nr:methyltransferase domain-containing protein [Bacteroidota bacterium]